MCTHVQSWGVEEATKGCTTCRGHSSPVTWS